MENRDRPPRPVYLKRDRARPRNLPGPSDTVVEERLRELIQPVTYRLISVYHRLGLRERLLTLPITVAMVLAMVWRQVPSVAELLRVLAEQGLLWAPPLRATEQAFNQRLRCLPAELFGEVFRQVLPELLARVKARTRPQPSVVSRALSHFGRIWVMDATTLEEVCHKVGLLEGVSGTILGGKLLSLLDLPSKLPIHLWWEDDPNVNENRFLDRVKSVLETSTLLILDRGFHGFPFFDYLTEHDSFFLTRTRAKTAYTVLEILATTSNLRDRVITLGQYRSNPCHHPVRRVDVLIGGVWYGYLTNVLDPQILTPADVVSLYGRRWRIEEAFLLVKRLLGLSYLWKGAANTIALQVWASWLLYAVLVDLSDAVAQELNLCLDQISIEMVYRGLYHFSVAHDRGLADDPVTYLATRSHLAIVKRRRIARERARLDKLPQELKL